MSADFLEASNLQYVWRSKDLLNRQKEKVLWNIESIKIRQSGIILLVGRNGAGKSTLMRCLLGLMKPSSGSIRWFGGEASARGKISYLPELPVLPARVKVSEFMTSLLGLSVEEFRAMEAKTPELSSLNVTDLFDRPAHLLSKGQQQRLLLTLSMAGSPKGFVMDEPFSGLDPWARSELCEHLIRLGSQDHFLLISSHDAPNRLRPHIRETWILENQTLRVEQGCAIPE